MHKTRFPRFLPLAAALFTLASAGAMAQATNAPAVTDSVRVTVGTPYHVTAEEAATLDRPYQLSNGQVFFVRQQDHQFFGHLAQHANGPARHEVELQPSGPGTFVTRKGVSLAFSNAGERVVIDDAQTLPGLRISDDMRTANSADGGTHIRLVSR
ncbi:hypothetical protein [Janthinobacterium sp. RB2R34]|uniref:hypothetical protein n=1 Tax=Janthinobacterium sp. RB2R34 TaxID=3424193 RepID=UPI003F278256